MGGWGGVGGILFPVAVATRETTRCSSNSDSDWSFFFPLLRLSRSLVPSLHACMHALSPPRSFSPVAIGSQCQFIFPVRR